jgi:hypothetical protein
VKRSLALLARTPIAEQHLRRVLASYYERRVA